MNKFENRLLWRDDLVLEYEGEKTVYEQWYIAMLCQCHSNKEQHIVKIRIPTGVPDIGSACVYRVKRKNVDALDFRKLLDSEKDEDCNNKKCPLWSDM